MRSFFGSKNRATTSIDLSRLMTTIAGDLPSTDETSRLKINRADRRSQTWAVCNVRLPTGSVREGVIVDISRNGARLRCRTRGVLPGSIHVTSSQLGLDHQAQITWQDTYDAGLRFTLK